MTSKLRFYSQLCFMAYLLATTLAHKAFFPRSNIDVKAVTKNVKDFRSVAKVAVDIRGGSDRSYDYDRYEKGHSEDYSNRYAYGSSSTGQYGTADRYGYNDDEYGSDQGQRRRKTDEDYYDGYEREYTPVRRPTKSVTSSIPDVGGVLRNGNKKVGIMLLGGGAIFTLLGISLFFNKTLMRLGNLLFIAGVPLFIGPGRTTGYFLQPKKARATGCLAFGIFLVLVGWPILGICLEAFGILNLFGNMFPVFMILLKQMPIVGSFMKGTNSGNSRSKSKSGYRDSYRYEDEEDDNYDREKEDDYKRSSNRYSDRYY